MPIYTYRCLKCRHQFDLLVGVTADSAELKCTACGASDVEKIMSSFSVRMGSSGSSTSSPPTSSCASGSCCPTC